jgi:hypothetical protein
MPSGDADASSGQSGTSNTTAAGGTSGSGGASAGSVGGSTALGGDANMGGASGSAGALGGAGSASVVDASASRDASRDSAADATSAPPSDGGAYYHTDFDLTEKPISENGAWHHTDPNQSVVATSDGIAYGTQNGSGGYDDSNAFLSGFPPNQRATAVIHRTGGATGNLEVELLLRWSEGASRTTPFGATKCVGYEINLQSNGAYVQIGRFKGLPALFDSLVSGSPLTTMGVHDGDVFSAEIVGNKITAKLNGTVIATATDTDGAAGGGPPIATGNPGVGFYRHDMGGTIDPKSCSFTSLTAEGL